MESKECIVCGKEFIKKVNRSQERWKAQKYCSVKCMGKKISKACLICGKHFLQLPFYCFFGQQLNRPSPVLE